MKLYNEVENMSFNSTMVRLKVFLVVFRRWRSLCFNSTMVRLKVEVKTAGKVVKRSFNSTMVRLKGKVWGAVDAGLFEFQFHNGSIKRQLSREKQELFMCFNSTMVRLKVVRLYHGLFTS